MKKVVIAGAIVLFLIIAIVLAGSDKGGREQEREGIESIQLREGFPVILTPVEKGDFEVWRDIQGKVEGYSQAFLSTMDAARVAVIHYKVGDQVAADTPIISLDEDDPQNISKVKLLRSVYEDALKEYERYEKLHQSGGISDDLMDKIRLKLKQVKTNLDAARATVHLTSPISGTLMSLYVRVGERAEPDKTLAMVSSLGKMRVVAAVSDRDVAELKEEQPVTVTSPSGKLYQGSVDRVSLGANENTGLFDLEMVIDNPDRDLKVGSYVTARVRIFHREDAHFVDSRTVLMDFDGSDYVFQADGGIARKVTVTRIAENDNSSLLDGLNPDLSVVLSGKSRLFDGAKLRTLENQEAG